MKRLLASAKLQIGFTFFRKSSRPREWGFTLIELLIAVTIIVVLISIGAVSYTTVNRNARNSQRQTDLQKIATALEQYFGDHHFYPTTNGYMQTAGKDNQDAIWCLLGGTYASTAPLNGGWSCTRQADGTTPILPPYNVYLSSIPSDPNSPSPPVYAYASNGQTYVLVTMCYEGVAPADHLFTTSTPYYNKATSWSGSKTVSCNYDWSSQYFVSSPQD